MDNECDPSGEMNNRWGFVNYGDTGSNDICWAWDFNT
jgi:hypothetical protein